MTKKVLVVDDDHSLREVNVRTIELGGYECAAAINGNHALDVAGQFGPDLVLTDYNMPNCDGYQLAKKLRQSGFGGRIILASGNIEEFFKKHRDARSYFDDFITKPAENGVYLEKVERLIGKPQSQ